MAQYLGKEEKREIFKEYGGSEENTGSTEAQIALFTRRMNGLSEHLQSNPNDHSSRKALLTLVGKRRRLLQYLRKKDIEAYRDLVAKLEIRK